MKLTLDESTTDIRALGDYLLSDEDLRRRGIGAVRHQRRKPRGHDAKQLDDKEIERRSKQTKSAAKHAQRLVEKCRKDRLAPVFCETLFIEGRACEALAKRIIIARDPQTGARHLKLGEEYEFVQALREAFAESEFDFFVNVTEEFLTFKVEHEPVAGDLFMGKRSEYEKANVNGQ